MIHRTNFLFHKTDPLDGIFRKFTPMLSNYFEVTASSSLEGRGKVKNVIDQSIICDKLSNTWVSETKENSSFTIKFSRFVFKLDHYTIASRLDNDRNYPSEWIIEGSNDNLTWSLLHYHPRNDDIADLNIVCDWESDPNSQGYFSFFKMTMLGENTEHYSEYDRVYFPMNKIEFFGQALISYQTCQRIPYWKYCTCIYILFIH